MIDERVAQLEERIAALEGRLSEPARIHSDALYTTDEAAAFLRCGNSTMYELFASGDLAVIKVGPKKGIRILGKDLLSFLDSRREGGPGTIDIESRLMGYLNR